MFEGMYAVSVAGHDRGKTYIIIKEENDVFFLSDGRLRPVGKPKRKKRKHVRLIKKIGFNRELIEKLSNRQDESILPSNEEIKRAVRLYLMEDNECQKPM
ncbi:MAG: KOW domain-containing RNA-binding protein [Lachnospiraceae bacterium]|nr:KOW domain-containing RNA-binding protein [Lachnospiraceae bacterium]